MPGGRNCHHTGIGRIRPLAFAFLWTACSAPDQVPAQASSPDSAAADSAAFRVVTVAEGLEHPWGIAFLPGDEGILVTERPGRLSLVGPDGSIETVPGLPPIRSTGEGGLLDVILHPAFTSNRLVYLSYSKPGSEGGTLAVARARLVDSRLAELEDVFVADAWGPASVNHGGRLLFDRAGYLFVTIGDRRDEARVQDLGNHVGTIVRLRDDGTAAEANPFAGQAGARSEIFAYGVRNPLGIAIHPEREEIWHIDMGPAGGDRLDRVLPGANYGWPTVSFGSHYDGRPIPEPGEGGPFRLPVTYWRPGLSPAGLEIYGGTAFPGWQGDYFVASLAGRHLRRLRVVDGIVVEQESLLDGHGLRIRTVQAGPDGSLYLLEDAPAARILRLVPSTSPD